jgi:ribosomal protein L7Ae-like RNA K-turn-binding protein
MRQFNERPSAERDDEMMIFGIRPVIEAIDSGKEVERIFIQRDLNNPLIRELKDLLKKHNIVYTAVPVEKLNRLTRKTHQGVVCYLSNVTYQKVEDIVPVLFEREKYPLVLMLDRITDVRNFGAICRTAECFDVDAVIIPQRWPPVMYSQPWSPTAFDHRRAAPELRTQKRSPADAGEVGLATRCAEQHGVTDDDVFRRQSRGNPWRGLHNDAARRTWPLPT